MLRVRSLSSAAAVEVDAVGDAAGSCLREKEEEEEDQRAPAQLFAAQLFAGAWQRGGTFDEDEVEDEDGYEDLKRLPLFAAMGRRRSQAIVH